MEDLKSEEVEFGSIREFLLELKKKFGRGDKKSVKVAELKRIKQGGKTMEEFVQEFKRVVRESGYEGRVLVEELKRRINKVIRKKLIEIEKSPTSIEQ